MQRVINSAGVFGGRICLFLFPLRAFRGSIYLPLLLPLTSSPQSFALGMAGTCLSLFFLPVLRYIMDIDDPNYCNEPLYHTPHTHTYIAYLLFTSYYT